MSVTPANLRRNNWNVTFNSVDLGGVDEVDPDLELMLEPITVGSMGKAILGYRIIGLSKDEITVEVREITRAIIEKLIPWSGGAGAAIDLSPPVNTDIYAYAQVLLLHPNDVAGGTTSQDLEFLKAVPIQTMNLKRDGQADDVWQIKFKILPDRSQYPALKYGTVKA
jgi:hypothetical protein